MLHAAQRGFCRLSPSGSSQKQLHSKDFKNIFIVCETTTGCLDTVHTSCWYGNGLMALRGTKEAPKQRKNQTHM